MRDMNPEQTPIRLSISQTAALFGISERTIRSAIKKGEVRYIVVRNRYKLSFDSLLAWSQKSTRRRNKRDTKGIGKYVATWYIRNKKYSPNPKLIPPQPNNNSK